MLIDIVDDDGGDLWFELDEFGDNDDDVVAVVVVDEIIWPGLIIDCIDVWWTLLFA